jgi:GDP-mannose 6-dehydrogenase
MKISVFGLGYVGAVSAACFAKEGHEVTGVDVSQTKVDIINSGNSPIVEEGITELTAEMVAENRLRATTDITDAIENSNVSLVCVGTPSNENGSLKLDYVERVSQQIGEAISKKTRRHTVVMRSTMLPGTIENLVKPLWKLIQVKKRERILTFASTPNFCARELRSKIFTRRRLQLSAPIPKKAARFSVVFTRKLTRRFISRASKSPKWSSIRAIVFTA